MSTTASPSEDTEDDAESPEVRRPQSKYIFSYGRALEPKFHNPSLAGYYRPWRFTDKRISGVSKVFYARTRDFRIALDVSQFAYENIAVKTLGNIIIVECRHDFIEDRLGQIMRRCTRKYKTPPDVKLNTIHAKYKKGFLFLWADRVFEQVEKTDVAEVEEKPTSDVIALRRHQLNLDSDSDKSQENGNPRQIAISIEYSPESSSSLT